MSFIEEINKMSRVDFAALLYLILSAGCLYLLIYAAIFRPPYINMFTFLMGIWVIYPVFWAAIGIHDYNSSNT